MSMPMRIRIKRLPGSADIPLPSYKSDGAAGMDVNAAVQSTLRLEPGRMAVVPCGFALEVPAGYEAQLRPRSGLASKYGITLVNSPGTIDSDYRGEVGVALINLGSEAFEICRGSRIAQMVITPVCRADWDEVKELSKSSRGSGGFGHTGA